jgi:hypothetical protein
VVIPKKYLKMNPTWCLSKKGPFFVANTYSPCILKLDKGDEHEQRVGHLFEFSFLRVFIRERGVNHKIRLLQINFAPHL